MNDRTLEDYHTFLKVLTPQRIVEAFLGTKRQAITFNKTRYL